MFNRVLNIPLKDICMMHKIVWKGFWEVILIFVLKVLQIFLRRYFKYFNDHSQNSYFAEHWGILQPATLPEKKNPFIFILPGFSKLFRNTCFKEHHFVAASGRGLSGIFWNFYKTISSHIKSNIKPPTSYYFLKLWRYLEESNKKHQK